MYLKLLIPLIIPFFSNFIHCFKNFNFWFEHYNEIRSNAEAINDLNAIRCKDMETNSSTKYQVCQRVFKLLRDDTTKKNPYRHSLYVNYDAFILSLIDPEFPICQEKNIDLVGKFVSLNCYGSSPVRSANSQNEKYLKEISVFYGVNERLIVLKCDKSNAECDFLELYDYNEWHHFSEIPLNVLNIPIPQYATIDKLKYAFHGDQSSIIKEFSKRTASHFLHKRNVNAEKLSELCDLLLGNHKIKYKYKVETYNQSNRAFTSVITIFEQSPVTTENSHNESKDIQKVKFSLKTFNCSKYIYSPKKGISMYFKLLPGLDNNSVILIEPLLYDNEKYLVPSALIENIHWIYVLNRDNWF